MAECFFFDDLDDEDKMTPREMAVSAPQAWTDSEPQANAPTKKTSAAPSQTWRDFAAPPEEKAATSAGCLIQ